MPRFSTKSKLAPNKKPEFAPWLSLVPIKSRQKLSHEMLELATCFEFRIVASRDRNGFTGLRIAAFAGFPLCFRESSETDELNIVTFLNGFLDAIHGGIQ